MTDFFNKFCETINKRTVVVLDNASVHKSKEFSGKIRFWKEKGLGIYFIPPYSPELNLIEIFWRFVKYRWLPFEAYTDFSSLKKHLKLVLEGFGEKHRINFS